ncbi:sensor histidine kinase [Phaeocystidibacter luteus]|uniref:Uncharacterized protein n=1 Tax=Phaeocystidibacter luteus TaxID=911197 RepID=A0A6N6RFT1_9FLAO|nr:histidine kinase [Phaeocystidibacter luteus]KAB2806821.1 hypothetical protein F8C67_13210 [Phaeocystidibacter luteus]
MFKFLYVFLIATLSIAVSGQSFEPGLSLNTADRIPVDEVYQVKEDHLGRLFIASDQGIFMIDGSEVTQFTTDDGLVDNTVFKLFIDSENRIWALSFHGGLCYYEDDTWKTPPFNEHFLSQLTSGFPYYMAEDTETGIYYFDGYGEKRRLFSARMNDTQVKLDSVVTPVREGFAAYSLYNSAGEYFFSNRTIHEVRTIFYRREQLAHSLHKESGVTANGLPIDHYFFTLEDDQRVLDMIIQFNRSDTLPNGSRLIGTGHILWIEDKNGDFTYHSSRHAGIHSIDVYGDEIFVNHYRGGTSRFVYDEEGIEFVEVSFPNQTVSDVFKSSRGVYWVCATGEGLQRVLDFGVRTIPFPYNASDRIGRPFFRRGNSFIIAQGNTLTRYDIDLARGELEQVGKLILPPSLRTQYSYQNVVIEGNKIVNKAFEVTLNDNFEILEYNTYTENSGFGGVKRMYPGKEDSAIYYVWRNEIFKMESYRKDTMLTRPNSEYSCEDLIMRDGKIRFATSLEGLLLFEDGILKPAFPGFPKANTRISDYAHISNDWLAAATKDEGLLIFNDDTIYSITEETLLPEQFIEVIAADEEHVYLGFSKSIFVAKVEDGVITQYKSLENEFLNIEGAIVQIIPIEEGVLVETESKLTFLPNRLLHQSPSPSEHKLVLIDEQNQIIEQSEIGAMFRMERGKTDINVRLSTPQAFQSGLQKWYWRIDENDEWRISSDGDIRISNLRNGAYSFQFKFRDANGIFHPVQDGFQFAVRPLLSETWWFWTIVLSPLIILTINIIRNTLRQRRLSRELISSNMSSLKMQINPHFIFNSFNSIQYLISEKKNDTASQYLTRLAKLIRTTIERPELHRISLSEEIEYISEFLSLETMRLDGKMKFEISVSEEINQDREFIPPMLLQPILENAVWHGVSKKTEGGIVMVSVEKTSDALIVHIEDNGDGFPQDKWRAILKGEELRGSLGLRNVIKRLQLLSEMHQKEYKLDLVSAQGGTHFVLTLAL